MINIKPPPLSVSMCELRKDRDQMMVIWYDLDLFLMNISDYISDDGSFDFCTNLVGLNTNFTPCYSCSPI